MRVSKKKILVCSLIIICVVLAAAGTVANYTTDATARNVITSGSINVELVEQQLVGGELLPYPGDEVINILPGNVVSKIVTVRNLDEAAFVRAKYEILVTDANGDVMEISDTAVTVTFDDPNWIKADEDDGWYYYNDIVEADESTGALFKEVVFSGPEIDNSFVGCTIKVNVSAQAVQADNNGADVLGAQGWPEE